MAEVHIDCKAFVPTSYSGLFDSVLDHGHTHYWLKGGRGSAKSSVTAFSVILLLLTEPEANAVVVRKVENTLRGSVYSQLQLTIDRMGLSALFKASKSPLGYTYLPTGQQVLFRGADDPERLRELVFPKGYAAICWFEGLHEFKGAEEVHDVTVTLMRGGGRFWFFYTYNPPRSAHSWVNKEALARERRPDTYVHHSTYLDIMGEHPDWLGQPYIDEAEQVKADSLRTYEWEYLGLATGSGGAVFENVVAREVTDDEIRAFDRVHNGVDFGWWPDPGTLVRAEWQPGERRIVIFGERHWNKMTAEESGAVIREALTYADAPGGEPRYHDQMVWCDDTEAGKSYMAEYRRRCGINARPAPKGNMRRTSYYWLAGLREIAIDPKRCPRTYEELALCEFKRDRGGEWLDDFNDGNDHFIDALRYAFMDDMVRSRQ